MKTNLSEAPEAEDLSATTTAEERVAMVGEMTLGAWSLGGEPLPDYTRANMPGRMIRPDDR